MSLHARISVDAYMEKWRAGYVLDLNFIMDSENLKDLAG